MVLHREISINGSHLDHAARHCSLLTHHCSSCPTENSQPNHLEDLGNVFRVALLRYIAQLGCDIDSPTDVHVHLHGLFLNLCVQVCHGLQEGQQWLSSIIIQFRKAEIPHSISLTPGLTILKQYYVLLSWKADHTANRINIHVQFQENLSSVLCHWTTCAQPNMAFGCIRAAPIQTVLLDPQSNAVLCFYRHPAQVRCSLLESISVVGKSSHWPEKWKNSLQSTPQ